VLAEIRAIHQASRGLYGNPRIHTALAQAGIHVSRKRVARLMREAGIHSRRRVRRRVRTTDSDHPRPVAPNLLARDFSACAPNQKWVGDILGLWTDEDWLYVAALLDTFSRLIVGLAMSAFRDEALVDAALRMALGQRVVDEPLIHHTDRGSQYTADDYLACLNARGISVSMSRKGDPYDNAMMESFFSTLRAECIELRHLPRAGRGDWLCLNTSWYSTIVSGFIPLWTIVVQPILKLPAYRESLSLPTLNQSGSSPI
jgi:putative transposase